MKKVLIAAGGTGGHIYPALALAKILNEKYPDVEVIFWGSANRMESTVIPQAGYRFFGCDMSGTNGGISAKIKSVLSMQKGRRFAKEVLKAENPDICIGFGNYISVPLILAAHAMHISTMIHEQNSFAGKANKFLAHKVDAVAISYASNFEQMKAKDIRLTGNPQATVAAATEYSGECLKEYGLNPAVPFVAFMMGSLGSSSVSKVIDEACPLFDESYQVLVATGKSNEYLFRFPGSDRIKIVEYVDGKKVLKGCALAVTRAGATTMCEIGAIGCASVLIPSPYVPNNHQVINAQQLVNANAAVMLEEKDLSAESLANLVNTLMKDPERLIQMRFNALASGTPNAAYDMIKWMEELCA